MTTKAVKSKLIRSQGASRMTCLRVPPTALAKIKRAAKRDGRTMSSFILTAALDRVARA